jgi:hypothetical protein
LHDTDNPFHDVIYIREVTLAVAVIEDLNLTTRDCGGNPGPNPSYAAKPKSLRYCMGNMKHKQVRAVNGEMGSPYAHYSIPSLKSRVL